MILITGGLGFIGLHTARRFLDVGEQVVLTHYKTRRQPDSIKSEIGRAVGRSVQRVSTVLGALRLAEVVRYDTDGKRNRYRLKHTREVRNLLASLSRFVKAASVVAKRDR
jgi:nucleoside-diphosphate-sugar epimerase